MTDSTGTTSYGYDNASRLTARSAPGTGVLSIGFGYDNANDQPGHDAGGDQHECQYNRDCQ